MSFHEMEREIHEEPHQHAGDSSERHGMLIGPVGENPCNTRSEYSERDHEKEWSHRTTVTPGVRWGAKPARLSSCHFRLTDHALDLRAIFMRRSSRFQALSRRETWTSARP